MQPTQLPRVIDISKEGGSWLVRVARTAGEVDYQVLADRDEEGQFSIFKDGSRDPSPEVVHSLMDALAQCEREYTEEYVNGAPDVGSHPTLALIRQLHPAKSDRFARGLDQARRGLESTTGWHGLPAETVQETIVNPVLDGLGFTVQRRAQFEETPPQRWLLTMGEKVALVITDYLETSYVQDQEAVETVDKRNEDWRNITGFAGRIVFTNGREWRMYSQEEGTFPTVQFSLDEPGGFWDLFILSMTDEDMARAHR